MSKPFVNICTIGHIGHGKTTLTKAILKVLSTQGFPTMMYPDRAKVLEKNGIDPEAVCIDYETQHRHYGLSDCPGHGRFVNNMIRCATQMDIAILVVSAPDGLERQTIEHVIIAKQLGISNIVVFINKCDQVDEDDFQLEYVEEEVRGLLMKYGFDGESIPFVRGSGLCALEGHDPTGVYTNAVIKLMEVCDSVTIPNREVGKPFMLPINSVYDIAGVGTVVTGIIKQGMINVGEGLVVSGYGQSKATTSAELQMFKKTVTTGMAGDNVGLLLSGLKRADIKHGQVLCKPGMMNAVKNFEVEVYILTQDEGGRHKPFSSGYSPQFYFNNIATTGLVKIPSGMEFVMPGDRTTLEVQLIAPVPIEAGLSIIMRHSNITIGMGTVTKITTGMEILTTMEAIGSSKGKMSKSDIILANCYGRVYPPFIDQVFGSVTSNDMKVLKFKTNNPAAGTNLGHGNQTDLKVQLCPVVIDEYKKACLPVGCVATTKPWYYFCCIHRWLPFADLKQQDKILDGAVDASPLLVTYAGRGIGGCNDY